MLDAVWIDYFDFTTQLFDRYLYVNEIYDIKISTSYITKNITLNLVDGLNREFNVSYYPDYNNQSIIGSNVFSLISVTESFNTSIGEYNYTFRVILNDEIYDGWDLTGYAIGYGYNDSSGYVPIDNTYNIYNLGGLTQYESNGWAGKTEGGNVYEIYAADTRASIMIDTYDFDVIPQALPPDESERDLINYLQSDWYIHNPVRNETFDMHPTGRLLSTGWGATARPYTSYPLGFHIYDDNVTATRQLYIEKEFRRNITATDGEIVYVQFNTMNIDPNTYGGQFRVQEQSINKHGSSWIALQMRWNSTGGLDVYNSTLGGWTDIVKTSIYGWYNITAALDVSDKTVDIWVEGFKYIDDLPFTDNFADQLGCIFFGTINTVTTNNNFYIDDVYVYTDFDANYGGRAKAETIYRKLQHWSMKFGYGIEAPDGVQEESMQQGWIAFGVEYLFDNNFVQVYKVNVTPVDVGLKGENNWVKWRINWYNNKTSTPDKTDYLFTLYEFDNQIEDVSIIQREMSSFYFDMWLSSENASSKVGGRINGEWFGMSDKAPRWQFWRTNWTPKYTDVVESVYTTNLIDELGNKRYSKEVKLEKLWCEVYRTNYSTFHYKIRDISYLERKEQFGLTDLKGIDTPPNTPPKVPDMSHSAWLSPLYALFRSLGRILIDAIISASQAVFGGLDQLLVAIGLPPIFSITIRILTQVYRIIVIILRNLETLVDNSIDILVIFSSSILLFIPRYIYMITMLFNVFIEFYTTTVSLFTGGIGGIGNIWTLNDVYSFFQLWLICIFPFWEMERCAKSKDGVGQLAKDASTAYGMLMKLFDTSRDLIGFIMDGVRAIINLVRG
jgi:hypothetical protein